MDKYFSTHQVAKMCQVSRGSVIRWINENKLKAAETMGGHHRICENDIVDLLTKLHLPIPEELKPAARNGIPVALIVDDEESIRQVLKFFLKKEFPHFQIEEAADGFEAGMKIERFMPALVLLDILLPGQDGFSICKQIRAVPELSSTVIVSISGIRDESVKEKIIRLGSNEFLSKPFEFSELKEKIHKHLSLAGQGSA